MLGQRPSVLDGQEMKMKQNTHSLYELHSSYSIVVLSGVCSCCRVTQSLFSSSQEIECCWTWSSEGTYGVSRNCLHHGWLFWGHGAGLCLVLLWSHQLSSWGTGSESSLRIFTFIPTSFPHLKLFLSICICLKFLFFRARLFFPPQHAAEELMVWILGYLQHAQYADTWFSSAASHASLSPPATGFHTPNDSFWRKS